MAGDKFWQIPAFRQTFVSLGLVSLVFCTGIGIGTATVMLPQLKKNKNIHVDEVMASWIYSTHGFGSVPAVLTVPYLCLKKGYVFVFKIICLPMITSFFIQYFATTAIHLLISTLLQGLTSGGTITLGIVALTEYTEPRLRNFFLAMKSASFFWGIWVANIIGTFTSWRYIPVVGIWPALFSLVSCFGWPEGPYWLASVGRIEECRKSYHWLRGPGIADTEILDFIKSTQRDSDSGRKNTNMNLIRKTIVLRQFYMPLIVNCVLFCLYFSTAKTVVTIYALDIIKDITKNESTAYCGMLIIDGITVLGMYIGSYVAMRVRRRVMFLVTSAVTILFLYLLSLYLTLVRYEIITQKGIISLSLLILYSFCVSWGPIILSTSFLSEITPMRFKPFIISVGSAVFWCLYLLFVKLSPLLFKTIGMHSSFSVYATSTLICWVFLYKYLPETSNKTITELEYCFVDDKIKDYVDVQNDVESVLLQDLSKKV